MERFVPQASIASSAIVRPDGLIGHIQIERLGISVVLLEGTSNMTLRRAVGHIAGTAMPGQAGNVGIAGHRDTFFRPLRNVRADDLISDYAFPAISPDGNRVAVAMGEQAGRDIWILDVTRGGASTRFTFDPARDDFPTWSPDGKTIAFASSRSGQLDLYIKPADGSGEEKLLLKTDEYKVLDRFTKDGRFLLFYSMSPRTGEDLWALPFPVGAKPIALLQTQFNERRGRVSPDGRWLVYSSDDSGSQEIYVRPFTPEAPAGTGAKYLVSKGGGVRPFWRPDGKELFYLNGTQVMAADIDTGRDSRPVRLGACSVPRQGRRRARAGTCRPTASASCSSPRPAPAVPSHLRSSSTGRRA